MAGGWGGTRQTVPRSNLPTCAKHGRSGGDEVEREKKRSQPEHKWAPKTLQTCCLQLKKTSKEMKPTPRRNAPEVAIFSKPHEPEQYNDQRGGSSDAEAPTQAPVQATTPSAKHGRPRLCTDGADGPKKTTL